MRVITRNIARVITRNYA